MEKRRLTAGRASLLILTYIHQFVSQQLPQPTSVGVRGSDHRKVAVQADECQDEHAAVQVDCVDDMHSNAGGSSEMPVSQGCIHRPERQRQNEEEIRSREMQAVPVCEAAFRPGDTKNLITFMLFPHTQQCFEVKASNSSYPSPHLRWQPRTTTTKPFPVMPRMKIRA